eukprot:GHVU01229939.1.p1 GENE.GHVU01229939.1~~GHVU01229939.1.p1  ORF type:complete len:151 (+),score=13.74 GHVU01229939.1:347-799(+)
MVGPRPSSPPSSDPANPTHPPTDPPGYPVCVRDMSRRRLDLKREPWVCPACLPTLGVKTVLRVCKVATTTELRLIQSEEEEEEESVGGRGRPLLDRQPTCAAARAPLALGTAKEGGGRRLSEDSLRGQPPGSSSRSHMRGGGRVSSVSAA